MNRIWVLLLFVFTNCFSQTKTETLLVYYNSNDFSLSEEGKNKLIDFFSNEEISISSLLIEGFCDDIGSTEFNKILSDKRAQNVASFLNYTFNLTPNSIVGKGEIINDPDLKNQEELRSNNRRTSIIVTYTQNKINAITENNKSNKTEYLGYKSFTDSLLIGDKIVMKNLNFLGSLTVFEDEDSAQFELDKLLLFLQNHPIATIDIQGHVCCISASFKDAFDRNSGKNNLSETRAKKIYDYLIEKNIASNRMTYKGYGRKYPIAGAEEKLNRRVEILITQL